MKPESNSESKQLLLTVNVEVLGSPGAAATGRTLTLAVRKWGGDFMSQPPLVEKTDPIGPLDSAGKLLVAFKIPVPNECGHLMTWTTISGQSDDAKKTHRIIIDC
jgi:hypothetical protein